MIAMYTINAAYQNHLEHETGSIDVGKLADLIVLDGNLFEVPVDQIHAVRVLRTLLGRENDIPGRRAVTPAPQRGRSPRPCSEGVACGTKLRRPGLETGSGAEPSLNPVAPDSRTGSIRARSPIPPPLMG
jgi:hypothetical protein